MERRKQSQNQQEDQHHSITQMDLNSHFASHPFICVFIVTGRGRSEKNQHSGFGDVLMIFI